MLYKIIKIIAENSGYKEDEITLKTRFIEDLHYDSLDSAETIMALEEEFDIEIPDEDVEKLQTIEDVVKYIEAKTNEQNQN